jgi:hypothetical protein
LPEGCILADYEELPNRVHEELRRFSKEFYTTNIQRLTQMWEDYVDSAGDFVEK